MNLTLRRAGVIAGVIIAVMIVFLLYSSLSASRSGGPIGIEVSRGEESGGVQYIKVLVTNNSDKTFTNLVVDMGPAGKAAVPELHPGQTFDASPTTLQGVSEIRVTTDQGVSVTKTIASQ